MRKVCRSGLLEPPWPPASVCPWSAVIMMSQSSLPYVARDLTAVTSWPTWASAVWTASRYCWEAAPWLWPAWWMLSRWTKTASGLPPLSVATAREVVPVSYSALGVETRVSAFTENTVSVIGAQEETAYVLSEGFAVSIRVRKSGYWLNLLPLRVLSLTLCLSGQTPVMIVDQPGPERGARTGWRRCCWAR